MRSAPRKGSDRPAHQSSQGFKGGSVLCPPVGSGPAGSLGDRASGAVWGAEGVQPAPCSPSGSKCVLPPAPTPQPGPSLGAQPQLLCGCVSQAGEVTDASSPGAQHPSVSCHLHCHTRPETCGSDLSLLFLSVAASLRHPTRWDFKAHF